MRIEAILLAQRLDTRQFEGKSPVADTPLTLRVGREGYAVLFRFGVAVLFGLASEERREFLAGIKPVAVGAVESAPMEETSLEIALELISRTLEALHGLVQQKRMLRVEWYIVALIAFEITLSLYQMVAVP